MAEYIEKAELMSLIESEARIWGDDYDYLQVLGDIEDFPPADVQPVVRAEWENMNDDLDFHFRCSRCGEETWQTVMGKPRFKYCPMCGAKMGGDADG